MGSESQLKGVWDGEGLAAVKMALGRVGHDFGNLLTPLMAYPGLIRAELDPDSKAVEMLEVVERTAEDMVRITRQMLQLSLSNDFSARPFGLNDVVEVAVESTGKSKAEGTELEICLGGGFAQVDGGQEQVQQTVERLCRNGYEAMPDGGVLSVSTGKATVAEQQPLSAGTLGPGTYAVVCVSDSGRGIDEEALPRVFEPFFTTKRDRAKRGAGLGLTYVYLVAAAHGGGVDIEKTAAGEGTTVALYLCTESGDAPETETIPTDEDAGADLIPCANDRVLVVDDEESVRNSFSRVLAVSLPDAVVTPAADGVQALDAFREGHHGVILMDIHMPQMDGFSAFSEIENLCREKGWERPSVIFCTGFAPAEMVRKAVEGESRHMLLMKPIRGHALVNAIKAGMAS